MSLLALHMSRWLETPVSASGHAAWHALLAGFGYHCQRAHAAHLKTASRDKPIMTSAPLTPPATIAVSGLGPMGLPMSKPLLLAGFRVEGADSA